MRWKIDADQLESPLCLKSHAIHDIGSNAGAAPKGNAGSDEPMEGGGNNDESILDALSPELDDVWPLNSDEYEAAMKEYDNELAAMDQPPTAQQVLATMMELVGEETTTGQTNPEEDPTEEPADGT
jgi:hypothetical protein